MDNEPSVVLAVLFSLDESTHKRVSSGYNLKQNHTHAAAPKALFFVSDLIAANEFVITATKRLISQKLSTIMAIMKKRHETKYSASIIEYIRGAHCDKCNVDFNAASTDVLSW